MKLVSILVCFYTSFCFSQKDDFRSYFRNVDIADYFLYKKDTLRAKAIYDSLIQKYPDYAHGFMKLYYDMGEYETAMKYWCKLYKIWGGLESDKDYIGFDHLTEQEQQELIEANRYFEKHNNIKLLNFLDSIMAVDQEARTSITFFHIDTLQLDSVQKTDFNTLKKKELDNLRSTDLKTLNTLYSFFKLNGFPQMSEIGSMGFTMINIMLLHGLRHLNENDSIAIYIHNLLLDEIKKGNYFPPSYACQIDDYYFQKKESSIYGVLADYNRKIYTKLSMEELNKNRKEIGLGPLEYYLEMNRYYLVNEF